MKRNRFFFFMSFTSWLLDSSLRFLWIQGSVQNSPFLTSKKPQPVVYLQFSDIWCRCNDMTQSTKANGSLYWSSSDTEYCTGYPQWWFGVTSVCLLWRKHLKAQTCTFWSKKAFRFVTWSFDTKLSNHLSHKGTVRLDHILVMNTQYSPVNIKCNWILFDLIFSKT